jgi:Tol biopolymer transport system component/DNA-binding winged helix-turn-helix (wHTH) protein
LAHVYRFEDVQIDTGNYQVLKAGKAVPIEPKALNVLVFLVENRGRLIEKRELLDAVWGESFVTENVLTRAVAQLRKALEDGSKEGRFIETVPTRGYRFVAEVTVEDVRAASGANPEAPEQLPPLPSLPFVAASRSPSRLRGYAIAALGTTVLLALVGVGLSTVRGRSASPYLQIASATQITTSGGLSAYPTLSPDASEIAYCTDRGKGFEIFVRQLAPGGTEFQLTSDGGQNLQPAWSPDGKLIAYSSKKRGGIWVIPALGGAARKLTDFGSHPAWSKDGQRIAFQSGAVDDISADTTGANLPSMIWTVRSDGENAAQLTFPGNPDGGHGSPSWSPDGKHIVFVASLHGGSGLWSLGADGKGVSRLAGQSSGYYDPIYSPDGKSVVYGAVAAGVNYGLWQVRLSPDAAAAVEAPMQITNSNGTRIKNLAFSADGKKLVYSGVNLSGSLASLPISKSGEPTGEPIALTSDVGCRSMLPDFSPDGSRIVFTACRGRSGLPQQLWLINSDGSNMQELTVGPNPAAYPSWYPDGRRILFETYEPGSALLSVDTDTRQTKNVLSLDPSFSVPTISPDGTKFLLDGSVDGILNVWQFDLATGAKTQLTFEKEMAAYPAWSPDGKWIAYEIERGTDNSIAILPRGGGSPTLLTPFHGQHWMHGWSSDGDKVLYAMQGDDFNWNIWSVSRSTKIEKQLTHYTHTNAYVRYPAMSPRGDQIVYEYTETIGNIWMMQFK